MPEEFIHALIGGALIGLASSIILIANGKIAGISGILWNSITERNVGSFWRWGFLIGLIGIGVFMNLTDPDAFANTTNRPLWVLGIAGFLVGYGTRLGSGCTSGHGVCGISRFSIRSLVATMTFIVAGVITVFLYNLVMGG